jgi:hypothetical protein
LALRAWGNVAGNVLFCDSGKRQISALRVAIFRTTSLPFMVALAPLQAAVHTVRKLLNPAQIEAVGPSVLDPW